MTEPTFLTTTRTAYDTFAAEYADGLDPELTELPLERALLAAFAEVVRGPVADVGCGPGYLAEYLHRRGVADIRGVDLSPRMVALARRSYPHLRFDEGSITALDLPDGGLGGLICWYCLMHVPDDELPGVAAEFHRVVAPGGEVSLGFLTGDESLHRTEAFGHAIALDYRFRPAEHVVDALAGAGFDVYARVRREPAGTELYPRAFLLARRPK